MPNEPQRLPSTEYGRLLEDVLEHSTGYALSILRRRTDAEDAVQQAALHGLLHSDRYDRSRSFPSWWFTVLRNCCFDLLRERRRQVPLDEARAGLVAPEAAAADDWTTLADALLRLSPEHEAILRLRYFANLSYQELSQALAIPPGTVMSRLHYARRELALAFTEPIT